MLVLLASGEFIAEHGCEFVLLAADRFGQPFLEGRADFVLFAERVLQFTKLLHHFIFVEFFFRFVFDEDLSHLFEPHVDFVDRLRGVCFFEGCERGGLGSVE